MGDHSTIDLNLKRVVSEYYFFVLHRTGILKIDYFFTLQNWGAGKRIQYIDAKYF